MPRSTLYLLLAVLGAVVPYLFFVRVLLAGDLTANPLPVLFGHGLNGGFTADLLISSLVFWIWMFEDISRRGRGVGWPFVVLNLTVGLSCALPAYLWARSREAPASA